MIKSGLDAASGTEVVGNAAGNSAGFSPFHAQMYGASRDRNPTQDPGSRPSPYQAYDEYRPQDSYGNRAKPPERESLRPIMTELYSNPEHLRTTLDALFEKYDFSRDGFLDYAEAQNVRLSDGKPMQALADLATREEGTRVAWQSNDVWGPEKGSGVTKSDINTMIAKSNIYYPKDAQASRVAGMASQLFPKLDANQDGFLDLSEIDVSTLEKQNIKVSQRDEAAISTMKELYPEIIGASNDEIGIDNNGLTYADLISARSRISDLYDGYDIRFTTWAMRDWWT